MLARTHNGRPFRMLTLIAEYTRECLVIDMVRWLRSDNVLKRVGVKTLFIALGSEQSCQLLDILAHEVHEIAFAGRIGPGLEYDALDTAILQFMSHDIKRLAFPEH